MKPSTYAKASADRPDSLTGLVRQMLCCDQQLMADSLGMSRAMLSKIENGQRTLPLKTFLKVAAIHQALQNMTPAETLGTGACRHATELNNPGLQATSDAGKATKRWMRKMNWRLELARQHAEKISEQHTAAREALHRVEQLQQKAENQEEGMRLWLNVLRANARHKLGIHNADAVLLARLKVKVLEAAVNVIEAEGLENPIVEAQKENG